MGVYPLSTFCVVHLAYHELTSLGFRLGLFLDVNAAP